MHREIRESGICASPGSRFLRFEANKGFISVSEAEENKQDIGDPFQSVYDRAVLFLRLWIGGCHAR